MARRNKLPEGVYRKSDYDKIYNKEHGIYTKEEYDKLLNEREEDRRRKRNALNTFVQNQRQEREEQEQRDRFDRTMNNTIRETVGTRPTIEIHKDLSNGFQQPQQTGLPRPMTPVGMQTPYMQAKALEEEKGGSTPFVDPLQAVKNANDNYDRKYREYQEQLRKEQEQFGKAMSRMAQRSAGLGIENKLHNDMLNGFKQPDPNVQQGLPRPNPKPSPYMQARALEEEKGGKTPFVTPEQAEKNAINNLYKNAKEAWGFEGAKKYNKDISLLSQGIGVSVENYNKQQEDIEKYRKMGLYDNMPDPMRVSDEGLERWIQGYDTMAANKAAEMEQTEQTYSHPEKNWADVIDYVYDWNKAKNPGANMNSFGRTDEETKNGIKETAGMFFVDDIIGHYRDQLNNLPTQEEKRQFLYDEIMGSTSLNKLYGAMAQEMTPEEKAQLDAMIDQAIVNINNYQEMSFGTDLDTHLRNLEQEKGAYEAYAEKGRQEQQRRADMQKLQTDYTSQYGTKWDQSEYNPNLIPEPKLFYEEEGEYYEAQGTEAEKAYFYMNNLPESGSKAWSVRGAGNSRRFANKYYFVTQEQRKIFNEFFARDKQEGTHYADQFLAGLDASLETKLNEYLDYMTRKQAEDPLQGTVMRLASPITNMAGGIMGTVGAGMALFGNKEAGNKNSQFYMLSDITSTTRQHQNQLADEWASGKLGEWAKGKTNFLLNVMDSMADNIASMGVGKALSAPGDVDRAMRIVQLIMSSEATSNTMLQNLEAGRDPTEAALYAIGDGVIEWATEKWSLEALLRPDMASVLKDGKSLTKFLAKASIAEGSEEIAADLANMGLDWLLSLVNGHKTELQERYEYLVAVEGKSGEDASKQVLHEKLEQIGASGLAGFLSGLGLGLGRAGMSYFQMGQRGSEIQGVNSITEENGVKQLLKSAEALGPESTSAQQAARINEMLNKGKKPGRVQLGKLSENIQFESQEQISNEQKDVIRESVYDNLKEKNARNARKLADIITKARTEGTGSLTRAETRMLEASQEAQDTLKDLYGNSELSTKINTELEQRTEGARSAQQAAANLSRGYTAEGVNAKSVGEHMATEDEIRNARGTRVNSAREVVVNSEQGGSEIGTIEDVKQQRVRTKNGTRLETRFGVKVNGEIRYVEASDLKATKFGTAAVIREQATGMNSRIYSADYTKTLLNQIESGNVQNVGTYMMDAEKIRWDAYMGREMSKTGIEENAAREIYRISQQDAAREWSESRQTPVKRGAGNGRATFNGIEFGTTEFDNELKKMNLDQQTQDRMKWLGNLAKTYGLELSFVDLSDQENGWMKQGKYQDGKISINITGRNATFDGKQGKNHHIVVTMGHEMTHYLKDAAPAAYLELKQFVLDSLEKEGVNVAARAYERMARRANAGFEIGMMEALDEMVADACDQVLNSEENIKELQQNHGKLYKKIKSYVSQLVKKIAGISVGMEESMSWEASFMKKYANELNKKWFGAYNQVLTGQIQQLETQKIGNQTFTEAQIQESQQILQEAAENPVKAFSMAEAVEVREDGMVAVHNVSVQNLMKDIRMKGFPMPSIAAVPAGTNWSNFGNVSIFFHKSVIDSAILGERVYTGDAYTPVITSQPSTLDEAMTDLQSQPERRIMPRSMIDAFRHYKKIRSVEGIRKRGYAGRNMTEAQQAQINEELKTKQKAVYDSVKSAMFDSLTKNKGMSAEQARQYLQLHEGQIEQAIARGTVLAMEDVEGKLAQGVKARNIDTWGIIGEQIENALDMYQIDAEGLDLQSYDEIEEAVMDFNDFANENITTDYVEVKPNEAIGFQQIAAILLPNNVSQDVIDALIEAGMDENGIMFYGNEKGNTRKDMMKQVPMQREGVMWSMAEGVDTSEWKTFSTENGEMYSKDQKGNKVRLTGLDREYVEAWNRSDFDRMEEILMDKIRENGAVPFKAPAAYSTPNHRWIANEIKKGNMQAVQRAAAEMAEMVPKNAVLVPMPNHHGIVDENTDTMILANEIAKITGRPVINALEGVERESRRADKAKPKSKQMTVDDLGFRQVQEIPEGTIPYFVDNVIASGLTAQAAHQALGNNGVTLAYAKSTMSANDGLKRANVTFYDTNGRYGQYLIPLSERIDMSKTGYKGTKFSVAELEDGTKYVEVDTDQEQFAGKKPKDMLKAARKIIKEMFIKSGNNVFELPDGTGRVTIDSRFADEYSYSSKRALKEASKRAKGKASTEIDNLIKVSKRLQPGDALYPNESYGHDPKQMKYYGVLFRVNGRFFTGVLNVEVNKNSQRIIDFTQIKIDTSRSELKINPTANKADIAASAETNISQDDNKRNFSIAEPIERRGDLIAVHNLTPQNLLDTLQEGGFTAPSVAVVRARQGHSKYGTISVVFKKTAIDPLMNIRNKIYGTDAWTPTRSNAQIETEIDGDKLFKAQRKISDKLESMNSKYQREADRWMTVLAYDQATSKSLDDIINDAYRNIGMLAAFRAENGQDVIPGYRETKVHSELHEENVDLYNEVLDLLTENGQLDEFMQDMESKTGNEVLMKWAHLFENTQDKNAKRTYELIMQDGGTGNSMAKRVMLNKLKQIRYFQMDGREIKTEQVEDEYDTLDKTQQAVDRKAFDKWMRETIGSAFGTRGVRNDADLYTYSGSRRSFRQTHWAPTAENIVKAMYRNHDAKGGEAGGATGLMAKASKEYRNLDEVRSDKGRLQNLDENEYKEKVNQLENRLNDFVQELQHNNRIETSTIKAALIDAAGEYARTERASTLSKALAKNGITLTEAQLKEAISIMEEAREIPTGYFEAKPERVVGFDEIEKVIVPSSEKELIAKLDSMGIPVETYDGTEESRLKALNKQESAMFSVAEPQMDVANWMMNQTPSKFQTEGERQLLHAYRSLRTSLDLCLKKQADYQAQIRQIESKQILDAEDRDTLTALRNKLEIQVNKQARLENEIYEATSSEGFAGMMYRQRRLMQDFIEGKTQAQVEAAVDSMSNEAKRVAAKLEKNEKTLQQMGEENSIKTIRRELRTKGLQRATDALRKQYNTAMSRGELEGRMAEIVLKKINGQDITADVEALANDVVSNQVGWGNQEAEEALSTLRGRTIQIGPGQQTELKAMHLTLKDIRARTKGSGVKFEFGNTSTLDSDIEELEKEIPALRGLLDNEKGSLEEFVSYIENLLEQKKGNAADLGIDVDDVALYISTEAEMMLNDEMGGMSAAQIQERILKNAGEIGRAQKAVTEARQSAQEMEVSARKAAGWASFMQRDVAAAIDYYNQIARQAAEVERQRVRKDVIEQLKSENTRKLIEQQDRYQEMMKNDKRARELRDDNETIRKVINTNISRFRRLLTQETDVKNIQEECKPLARFVSKLLLQHDMAGFRHVLYATKEQRADFMDRLTRMEAQDGPFDIDKDLDWLVIKAPNPADNDTSAKDKVTQDLLDIEQGLLEYRMAEGKGTVSLQDRKNALQKVQAAVSEIQSVIRARGEATIEAHRWNVLELAETMKADMENSRFKGERVGRGSKFKNAFWNSVGYGNLTPEYFIKNLKNRTMTLLHRGMQDAEQRSGLEARKAKERIAKIAQDTGFSTWDGQQKHTVKTIGGSVEMTTEQIMALYATWKREQNALRPEETSHLLRGGFVLGQEDTSKGKPGRVRMDQRPIKMTEDMLNGLGNYLTDNQRQYVDEIVDYMSGDLAALGNEASMRMFGIKKYTEQYYFPIKSWGGVLNKSSASGTNNNNDNRAARQSFTKRIQAKANNAVEITDFTPTAMKHVVGMINYNTVAPAVENLNKVLNQQLQYGEIVKDEEGDEIDNRFKRNMRAEFQNAYGKAAYDYLTTFMQDVNGGVSQRHEASLRETLLSAFKKNAVAGSLSVAAQQPLSYIRASMLVNPKYLAQAILPQYWKGSYAEMMKYSGVAVIKEMGRFDMNFGRSMQDYITPDAMRTKAQVVGEKISDVATGLPQKMDAMTWTRMWSACKLETAAQHPGVNMKSEAFLEEVADRFNELMRKTQVYDSVMVKSQNMRSTSYIKKVATSFMAEPTLSLNVLADAWQNLNEKGGKKNAVKALATFLLSAAAQAGVKGLFGAGRTPDKKKTREENFLNKFLYNLMGEMNPLGLIPGYNSLIEVLTNGELEDDAMSVLGKAVQVYDNIFKLATTKIEKQDLYRVLEDSIGQLCQLATDVPLKNIMRDFRAMVNWFSDGRASNLTGNTYAHRQTSGAVLKYSAIDTMMGKDLLGLVNKRLGDAGWKTTTDAYAARIYAARKAGNVKAAEEMSEYLTLTKISGDDPEKTLQGKLNKLAKEDENTTAEEKADWMKENATDKSAGNYVLELVRDGELTPEQAMVKMQEIYPERGADDLYWSIDRAQYKRETGEDASGMYYRLKKAIRDGDMNAYNENIKTILEHGGNQNNEANVVTDALKDGTINEDTAKEMLRYIYKEDEKSDEDLYWMIDRALYKKETGDDGSGMYYRMKKTITEGDTDGFKEEVKTILEHGGKQDSEANVVTDMLKDGEIDGAKAKELLRYIYTKDEKSDDDLYWMIDRAQFKKETGEDASGMYYRLKKAIRDGDTTGFRKEAKTILEHGGKTNSEADAVTDMLMDGTISAGKATELLRIVYPKNEKTDNDIWFEIDRTLYKKATGNTKASGNYYRLKDAMNNNRSDEIRTVVNDLVKHGIEKDKIKKYCSQWKQEYLDADSAGKIKIRNAIQMVYKSLGLSANDADKTINGWKEKKQKKNSGSTRLVGFIGSTGMPEKMKDDSKIDFDNFDPIGQYGRGNIDLNNRQVMDNGDGSISTERSFSFYDEDTGKEILVPTVINGRVVSEEEAIDHYYETGEYLGMFDTYQEADKYAKMLHERQDWYYHR